MRRLLLLLPLLAGCPPPGYNIRLDVTAPLEVQAACSASRPGFVMTGRFPIAMLCDPTGSPFTARFLHWENGHKCTKTMGGGFENMYLFAPSQSDLDTLYTDTPTLRCGQTRAIDDQTAFDAITQRAIGSGWETNALQTIATGSGGSCDAGGNFTGTVLLHLVK
jgi:hypothetical protein